MSTGPGRPRRAAAWLWGSETGRGSGGGSPVGSGRGLGLRGGLDARERGGAGTGVRTLGPPGAEPGRREVTAGILRPRVTQLPRRPETAGARGARGPGGGSHAGSGKGRPRSREAGRKWGATVPGDPILAGPRRRDSSRWRGRGGASPGGGGGARLPQVAGAGRRAGRGRSVGGETPPPAFSLPPALGAPRHCSAPAAVTGPWVSRPPRPPARPLRLRRDGRPR